MKPKYCPNCATKLIDESFYLKQFTILECKDTKGTIVIIPVEGWGVECHKCNWGGEILPYEEEA